MRNYTILVYGAVLFILIPHFVIKASVFQQNESVDQIEGMFYLDNKPIFIEIKNGYIENIVRSNTLNDEKETSVFIAPGFIDAQVNGYLSYSFSAESLNVEQIRTITRNFWQSGITSYLPTLTTSSFQLLKENFSTLDEALKDPAISSSIPGFHLEGPYISREDGFRGAHNIQWVRNPDWDEFTRLYEASGEQILLITLAPELPGAIDFINRCNQKNIIVALGHHNGSAEIIRTAVDTGALLATHLGNGCANLIHRHENPLWPQLADDRLTISLIADGFHLRPEEIRTFYKVKGPEKTILISDVTSLGGMPPGNYELFGQDVVMTTDGVIKMPSQDVLAGASFLVTKGIENIMKFTGCSLAEAIHMVSRNPARLLGLEDRGEISVGKRADLILFEIENGEINILKTLVKGRVVYQQEKE